MTIVHASKQAGSTHTQVHWKNPNELSAHQERGHRIHRNSAEPLLAAQAGANVQHTPIQSTIIHQRTSPDPSPTLLKSAPSQDGQIEEQAEHKELNQLEEQGKHSKRIRPSI
jgi:hypothetical protein